MSLLPGDERKLEAEGWSARHGPIGCEEVIPFRQFRPVSMMTG